jgi:hypothetical protein
MDHLMEGGAKLGLGHSLLLVVAELSLEVLIHFLETRDYGIDRRSEELRVYLNLQLEYIRWCPRPLDLPELEALGQIQGHPQASILAGAVSNIPFTKMGGSVQ